MAPKLFNKFWVTVTAIITVILFIYLFPLLLDKYGLLKAILWISLLPVGMTLAYLRGYWIHSLISKKRKTSKE